MGIGSSTIANIGMGFQASGAASSVIGSYYATRGQQAALRQQAQADLNSARSGALAATGSAALDAINAQAEHNASLTGLEFSRMQAQHQAAEMRLSGQIALARASASAASAEFGAQIDENNAALLELKAQSALLRGERDEQASRMKFAQEKSRMTASMAARGLDLSEGAPLTVRAGYDVVSEQTAIQIQQQVLMDAYGLRVSAANERISAAGRRASAAAAMSAASMEAAMANANATFTAGMANAAATAGAALARAGLLNANAAIKYRTDMTAVGLRTAEADYAMRRAQARGMSPGMAAFASLLSAGSQVAGSWYSYRQSTGKVN